LYERLNDQATVYKLSLGEIEIAVKMRLNYCRTKRPRGALLQLGIEDLFLTV